MIFGKRSPRQRTRDNSRSRFSCPVCRAVHTDDFFPGYRSCPDCEAVFLRPELFLIPEEERERYLLHENDPDDPGYREFLSRLAGPLLERLPAGQEGLDYGCGPGPALARILEEAGHRVRLYNPFFHRDPKVLEREYDFITYTETAEHFHDPAGEFFRLDELLKSDGLLGVMTAFLPEAADFPRWHYRRDPTHVVFYRETTFRHLADRFDWEPEFPVPGIFIGRKSGASKSAFGTSG